jgi:hypothetical protein
MASIKITLYVLATLTCLLCTLLLYREYLAQRTRLLLWSALCFVCLTVNNVLLFVDLVVLPSVDLRILRLLAALAGMLFLLYGFIWESDSEPRG